MKTKIVYTLVSSPSDFYLEQALLSVYSLRLHNPRAIVELAVDQFTAMTLVDKREEIKRYITNLIEIVVPEDLNKVQRSRYLKTNLRKFIKGDYLFIDCDTIICESLACIDEIDADIAMVADANDELLLYDKTIIERCKKVAEVDVNGQPYFNSGVIYAKDIPKVHRFYNEWYENWCKSDKNGVRYDQPALCVTNVMMGKVIHELDGIWNCQFKMMGCPFLKNAKIMHYYSNNGENDTFFTLPMDLLYHKVRDEGIKPPIEGLIRHPRTDIYAVMTVDKERFMSFFCSHQLYLYTNRPFVYRVLEKIGNILENIIYK